VSRSERLRPGQAGPPVLWKKPRQPCLAVTRRDTLNRLDQPSHAKAASTAPGSALGVVSLQSLLSVQLLGLELALLPLLNRINAKTACADAMVGPVYRDAQSRFSQA